MSNQTAIYDEPALNHEGDSGSAFIALLSALRDQIADIVIPDGEDAGVILLSDDSPSDYDATLKCQVYRHMYFSPLGDALVALWQRVDNATKELEMERQERMLAWFVYDHLPEHLQAVSKQFHHLALQIVETIDGGPERTVALHKLLESKDAAVRAAVNPGG